MTSDPTYTVTFVCSGNICRSPMAEVIVARAIQRAGLAQLVTVDSAGLGDWHIGQPADPRTVAALHRHGYDGSPHRARAFDSSEVHHTNLLVALDTNHHAALLNERVRHGGTARIELIRSFDPTVTTIQGVSDPYYGTEKSFDVACALIEAATPGLVQFVATQVTDRTHSGPQLVV